MRVSYKRITSLLALLVVLSISLSVVDVQASTSSDGNHFTYIYDCWGYDRESPDAYSVTRTITGADFECGNFKDPEGLYVNGQYMYVADSGNNRILEFTYINDKFEFIKEISKFQYNGKEESLKTPQDVYVNDDGDYYIADTGNFRIVHLDKNLNVVKIITKPEDETVSSSENFIPQKLVVDSSKRIFCQAQNVNKGFMEFADDGSFTGYVGASKVTYNFFQYLWKLVATKEQRERMALFVPTEYSNLCLDSEGFIYATIAAIGEDVTIENAQPIRKLNAKGTDILVRNGYEEPYGDLRYTPDGEMKGPSKFVDITCLDNDVYYALDNTRGRVFAYDFQGNMLYAFGGHGYKAGYFINAVALEDLGDTLCVLDANLGSITQFSLTDYGTLINQGLSQYKVGDYDGSASTWRKVLKHNGNYDQAYIGIGRSELRQKHYAEAMKYFKIKLDSTNYSKAYKLYRKEWFESNILYILAIIVLLVLIGFGRGFIVKARKEVERG
ncbi:hypothetical protein [Eubacterium xylanophilum]|uniref:hypothetical protein n=1 Tax=Eubacterium xylanophilum TaxID=39497 RepID=UPI0004BB8ED6|nr:hypothetical protein [Eubacterium xylanophilum]MCR5797480.1 hypothetical protein [Eubacterium sp.]